jgi:protein O-GlcNAc transferase
LADYLIGDSVVTPLEHAPHYSETLALMPNSYQPNERGRKIDRPPSRSVAGLPAKGFVFCCFNQAYKLTPIMFDLWCDLLRRTPGSLLWLLRPMAAAQTSLRNYALARGVAPDRLVFAPPLPIATHLARLQLADLALDTYPVTSHTTASDALRAGVPLVTMMGDAFASRVAASVLQAAGLPELITHDPSSYFELALDLATHRARLKELQNKLSRNLSNSPLFDSLAFTRDLERLYERMWADHRSRKKVPLT